jgi:methylenetetrahydrofolate dehydrogenase (NADP+)/methenyltetrahydrofolate cyclohydrolase
MAAMILDGKEVAAALERELAESLAKLKAKRYEPKLAIILAGDSKPSAMYASFMQKAAKSYGINSGIFKEAEDVSEDELGKLITDLSNDDEITGILMMMPLPEQIDPEKMIALIDPDKDVDGLTDMNAGRLFAGKDGLFGNTPRAVMAILKHYKIEMNGKRVVVIGRSNVIGKPVSIMLLKENATVTICHSHTKDLTSLTREADVLVAAVPARKLINEDLPTFGIPKIIRRTERLFIPLLFHFARIGSAVSRITCSSFFLFLLFPTLMGKTGMPFFS